MPVSKMFHVKHFVNKMKGNSFYLAHFISWAFYISVILDAGQSDYSLSQSLYSSATHFSAKKYAVSIWWCDI